MGYAVGEFVRLYNDYTGLSVGSAFSKNIRGPKGLRGRVKRILGSVTATTSWSTLAPVVTVTTTAAPVPNRKNGNTYNASTQVFTATLSATTAPAGFVYEQVQTIANGPGNVLVDENLLPFTLPADADIVFAMSAATGTPAGTIDLTLETHWF